MGPTPIIDIARETPVNETLIINRFSYAPGETEAFADLPTGRIWTIERPWRPGSSAGGENFESCIPDGEYDCEYYQRSNGQDSIRLFNPDLGVYRTKSDRPNNEGRWDCLIHVGNYMDDVVGCIAPGLTRTIDRNRRMVANSRKAMRLLMAHFHNHGFTKVLIRPHVGTTDQPLF